MKIEEKICNIVIILVLFACITPFLLIGYYQNKILGLLNVFVLTTTLYFLIRYTHATEDMKKQTIRQNDFSQRPIVNLYFRSAGQNKLDYNHFALRNVGNAPAYNISIEDISLKEYWYAFEVGDEEFNNVILEKENDEKPLVMMGRKYPRGGLTFKAEAMQLFLSEFDLLINYSEEKYREKEKKFSPFIIKYSGFNDKNYYSIFKLYQMHPSVTDRVIEFVKTEEGNITYEEADKLCRKIPKSKSIAEKMYT